MKIVLTPKQMKDTDNYAIRTLGIPSLQLMENAGKSFVSALFNEARNLFGKTVVIFCGKGNNGGDGFVIARLLAEKNISVAVVIFERKEKFSSDAKINFERLPKNVELFSFSAFVKQRRKYDVIIDAIFGTSFRGAVGGNYAAAIQWINKQKNSFVAAVDIPSGLNGESGNVEADAVRADFTITFSNPKTGFFLFNAKEFTGKIFTVDIGIPEKAVKQNSDSVFVIEKEDVAQSLPQRPINSHKHSVGKIFILAGSKGLTGAALLCSQSAIRSGAGSVILGVPDSEFSIIAKRTLEVMPFGLPATKERSVAFSAYEMIQEKIKWCDVLLLGPGLSQQSETQELIRKIIMQTIKPMLIDADGLNALALDTSILLQRKSKNVILTPHLGEFSRLTGMRPNEIENNKISIGREFAKKYKLTLVLKGAPTFTFLKNGKVFINSTGNPGMSTAGSGDVLSGIIASFLAQGNSMEQAAVNGVYIHGAAGDMCAEKFGIHGLIAGDIIKELPFVIKKLSHQ